MIIILFLSLSLSSALQAATSSIFVEVFNDKVKVSKAVDLTNSISISLENKSNSDYFMKLINDKYVIKRFTLRSNKTFSFDFFSKEKGLKLIPVAPAFRSIPLERKKRTYEISKI